MWFFQGALLADKKKLLVNAQEGRTKALRQMRFQSADEIRSTVIKLHAKESIQLAVQGKSIKPARNLPVEIPIELKDALSRNKTATSQLEKMSKTYRREYVEYIASAKQDETRKRRLAKILPMIAAGVGMNDKYR